MSSQDDDVAAILSLPSTTFAPKGAIQHRRKHAGGVLVGSLVLALALGAGALSLAPRGVILTSEQNGARQPPSPIHAPLFGARPLGMPGARVSASAHKSEDTEPLTGTVGGLKPPPPPPPPSAEALAELRVADAPRRVIASSANEALKVAQVERLTTSRAPLPDLEEPEPEPVSSAWIAEPSGLEVASAYPPQALRDGAPGSVVMACIERVDGRVRDCRILDERPFGVGFGQAALHLSRRFRFSPVLVDGRPVEAEVRIPYDFSVMD